MRKRAEILRFSAGLLASTFIIAVVNDLNFSHTEFISDAWYFHGWPFTFYRHGGFTHEHAFVWLGFLADLAVTIAMGIAIGWFWGKISERRSSRM